MSDAQRRRATGQMIRRWRRYRRLSQMELALDAGFSPRHMSFIETGRSRPSRQAVLAIAEVLEVPLHERNLMLEAAGHAREYPEHRYDDPRQRHLRSLMQQLLQRQEPYFAVAIDHRWDILMSNAPARSTISGFFDDGEVPGPPNLLRMTLHPMGLRSAIVNLDQIAPRLLRVLGAECTRRPDDPRLRSLLEELKSYQDGTAPEAPGGDDAVPLILETPRGRVRLVTLVMDFANPLDPAMDEIRLETFLPADDESAEILAGLAP